MHWTPYDNGGFSTAPLDRHVRPILADGDYGFERVSVAAQRNDPNAAAVDRHGSPPMAGHRHCKGDDRRPPLRRSGAGERGLTEREIATTTDPLADRRFEPLDATTQGIRSNGFGCRWVCVGGL